MSVQIVGFSSSSLWEDVAKEVPARLRGELAQIVSDGRASDDEPAFNLWVAEHRAQNVRQIVEDQLKTDLGRMALT